MNMDINLAIKKATCDMFGDNMQLRQFQVKTLSKIAEGKDVFVCVPTASGKSLCYELYPLVHHHIWGNAYTCLFYFSI